MVHALKEIWRVLVPNGLLIDLRPRVSDRPLEIVSGGRVMLAGTVDNSPFIPDEAAADHAIIELVDGTWLTPERQTFFECNLRWDTLDDLLTYYAECESPSLVIPDAVAAKAHALVEKAGSDLIVQIRVKLGLATYRKREPQTPR